MRRRSIMPLVAITVAAAVSAGSAALAAPGAQPGSGESSEPLRLLWPEPTQGLDPTVARSSASTSTMIFLYGTLLWTDFDKQLVGNLAETWEVSEDGLTYTFHLRETSFSDGSPLTAEDVTFSLQRMRESDTIGGPYDGVADVTAPDDRTVVITLDAPNPNFPRSLASSGNAGIVSKAAFEADPDYFTLPVATSGPFVLDEYVPGDHITLVPNEHYYLEPRLTEVRMTFGGDQTAAAAALETGSADIAAIGYSDVARLEGLGTVEIFYQDQLAPIFFGWDRTKAPFDNLQVRQAFAYAMDRDGAQTACWFNTGAAIYGNLLRPWDPAYVEITTYQSADRETAIAKAGELLDEAGWVLDDSGDRVAQGVEGVEDGTPLEVDVPYENNWPAAGCHTQVLQDSMRQVGVTVTPQSYDAASFYQQVAANAFTMYHGGAGALDAYDLYLNWFRTGGRYTELTTHLADPELDARIDEALNATSEADAVVIFQELEQWQAEEQLFLATNHQWLQVGVSERVQDFQIGNYAMALTQAWIED